MKGFGPLHPLELLSSSSFFAHAFGNALTRCVVTMDSNVSDRSDAWRGVLLHAHMSDQECHTEWATRRFTPGACTPARPDVSISVRVTANICARAQSGVCQGKTAAASCRDKLPVAAVQKTSRSAKISTNQTC